jgi:hypothetical protein
MKKSWNKITAWFRSLRIKYILWRADRIIAKVHKKQQEAQKKSTISG